MSADSLDDQRKLAEVEKTRAETRKIDREAEVASRQLRSAIWTDTMKVLGGVILGLGGAIAAWTQYEVAELKARIARQEIVEAERVKSEAQEEARLAMAQRDAARREREENEQAINELKASLAKVTSDLRSTTPEAVPARLAYLQFRGALSRDVVNQLRVALQKDAFTAPGAERVQGDYQNLVKYFVDQDRPHAERLARSVEAFFASRHCPLTMRIVPASAPALKNPPLEVWLAHSCTAAP